ncbi:MAG: 50S ribosomal protein L23 [Candidatus Pacebacteria bacterium]|nr:50S ribosomal protein L23 [Candidatus Paceibacterota bacterium]
MGLFKKDKKEQGLKEEKRIKKEKEKSTKRVVEKKPKESVSISSEVKKDKTKKSDIKIAPAVLSRPQITEKATLLQEENQYIFQVFKTATKPEVKKSVEEVYNVNVEKVRIINVDRKKKRLGRTTGWKKGYKKAIVTLKKGQEIEIIPR